MNKKARKASVKGALRNFIDKEEGNNKWQQI